MSSKNAYELFGGMLAATPMDDTSEEIVSENFAAAKEVADALFTISDYELLIKFIPTINKNTINYMNSPLLDFIIAFSSSRSLMTNAAKQGRLNVIKYLLEYKIIPKFDLTVRIALEIASENGHLDIIKYIHKHHRADAHDCLMVADAALYGHLNIVKYLADNGVDVHVNDEHALVTASMNGHLDIVKYLVEVHHADIHADDDAALRHTCDEFGLLDVIKYLIEAGANIHALNDGALFNAIAAKNLETVKYLLSKGANVHYMKRQDLEWATNFGTSIVADYLHNNGIIERRFMEGRNQYYPYDD